MDPDVASVAMLFLEVFCLLMQYVSVSSISCNPAEVKMELLVTPLFTDDRELELLVVLEGGLTGGGVCAVIEYVLRFREVPSLFLLPR